MPRNSFSKFPYLGLLVLFCCPGIGSNAGHGQDEPPLPSSFQQEFKKAFGAQAKSATAAEYLNAIVNGDEGNHRFEELIEQLGSDSYQQRQKAEATLYSLPILPEKFRAIVDQTNDMEIRFRLRSIFANRNNRVESLLIAALQTIADKRTSTSLQDVLTILANHESRAVTQQAKRTIEQIATRAEEPILLEWIDHSSVSARRQVARTLATLKTDDLSGKLSPLLTDPDEALRLEVARMLVEREYRPAIDTLIGLLETEKVSIATRAERLLSAVTGAEFGRIKYSEQDANLEIAHQWIAWSAGNLDSFSFRLPLADFLKSSNRLNGNTLLAINQSLIIELNESREEINRVKLNGVLSAEKTIDGNYVVFSYSAGWLREVTPAGETVWEISGPKFNNAMPLDNGHVLVTVGGKSIVRELDPKTEKTVWEFKTDWWPNDAFRLVNGNTLISGKGGIVEVTPEKDVVWSFKNPESSTIVVAKPTENQTILVGWTNGIAREISPDKKTVWEYRTPKALSDVFRDANGHTLIAASTEILEVDQEKKVVWRFPKQSKTATVRR